jgi:hypothetical protein
MRPFAVEGIKYFPQKEQLLFMLEPGSKFKTKTGNEIYSVVSKSVYQDSTGKQIDLNDRIPVTPLKTF